MKKFIGKSAAIAAAAFLFVHSVPVFNIDAADPDPGKCNLTIHPYLLDQNTYDSRKGSNTATGTSTDSASVSGLGAEDNTVGFSVTEVDEHGTAISNGYTGTGKIHSNINPGYYL